MMDKENKQPKASKGEKVYSFIVEFIKKNGYAPSIREIAVGVGINSTYTVHRYLLKLEDEGRIEMKRNSSRAIKVVGFQFVKVEESA